MNDKQLLQYINKQNAGKFSKRIVKFVILINIIFTAIIIWLFYTTGAEPTTLVVAFFGFTTVELWSLASIKKKKEEERND